MKNYSDCTQIDSKDWPRPPPFSYNTGEIKIDAI